MFKQLPVILILGPTASGKTALSYDIAKILGGQVVNMDIGSFYKKISIGAAKPMDWQELPIKGHFFDILDEPRDFSVVQYRLEVLGLIEKLHADRVIPIIVGGSLFYGQSLLFPPINNSNNNNDVFDLKNQKQYSAATEKTWHFLHAIDPVRAKQIHPNDHYRVHRAIALWQQTGQLPSSFNPMFNFEYPLYVIALNPTVDSLHTKISERTKTMLYKDGWIDEAKYLINSPWEEFIRSKGFIGYTEIFDALKQDFNMNLDAGRMRLLEQEIILRTTQYAKGQSTFLRAFIKKIFANKSQKNKLIIHSSRDYQSISLELVARLVAYLQK